MSYDVYLYKLAPGATLEAVLESLDSDDDGPVRADPALSPRLGEDERRYLAQAVREIEPTMEAFEDDDCIELATPEEDDLALEMQIFDSEVAIGFPYWHTGAGAGAMVDRVLRIVSVFTQRGFACWDPQVERELDPARDRDEIVETFSEMSGEIAGEEE